MQIFAMPGADALLTLKIKNFRDRRQRTLPPVREVVFRIIATAKEQHWTGT